MKRLLICLTLFLSCDIIWVCCAQTNAIVPAPEKSGDSNSADALRSYLRMQDQLHGLQVSLEENLKAVEAASARNSEAMANRLQAVEQSLAAQRVQELEAVRSSQRVTLLVAAAFASIGLLALAMMAWVQWRTATRLSEVAASMSQAMTAGPPLPALGAGEQRLLPLGPPEQSQTRLIGAIDRLEKRLLELEHTARAPVAAGLGAAGLSPAPQPGDPSGGTGVEPSGDLSPSSPGPTDRMPHSTDGETPFANGARISSLLGKGQSLLNLENLEDAIGCFDEVLELEPNNTDALMKKGGVLERLRKLDQALECYDRAIAVDSSLTIAYLHKGGLFNRMERFSEALACYEQALKAQSAGQA